MPEIKNISDTARWVAHYRALESARPDALFHDPLAARISGERGAAMARSMPQRVQFAWALSIRTRLIDDLILQKVRTDGIRFVLDLAAGFDTRPYRLGLPSDFAWIEADLGPLIDEKNELLKDEKPHCRLERLAVDLGDATARQHLMARVAGETGPGLVLTEGLLLYLDPARVEALARDLAATSNLRWWLSDTVSPRLLAMMEKSTGRHLAAVGAPFKFAPADPDAFFARTGWQLRSFNGMFEAGQRYGRKYRMAWFWELLMRFMSEERRREAHRMSGIIELERGAR
jgi:methyltransferase (TIGR00027 family)